MKKIMYLTVILSACSFILSGVFKILHLMGAPFLLISSAVFGCLFVILFAVSKFRDRYINPSESEKINRAVENFEKK
jgi:arginine exporter protein ArgO